MATILVVDDEPRIVQIAKDYLEHAGYSVVTAGDGSRALEVARTRHPALVVLDLKLPMMSGMDVAKALSLDPVSGVLIRGVVRNGPAERAGIQPRDVVLELDGKPTRDTPALLARIAELAPGSPVKVRLWRDRKAQDVEVTVGRRPSVQ